MGFNEKVMKIIENLDKQNTKYNSEYLWFYLNKYQNQLSKKLKVDECYIKDSGEIWCDDKPLSMLYEYGRNNKTDLIIDKINSYFQIIQLQ